MLGLTPLGTIHTAISLLSNPDDPKAQASVAVFFVLFLIGATWQVMRMRATPSLFRRAVAAE